MLYIILSFSDTIERINKGENMRIVKAKVLDSTHLELCQPVFFQTGEYVNISIPESLSARDIINLPSEKRQEILTKQFQEAEHIYKENPDLIVPEAEEPLEY